MFLRSIDTFFRQAEVVDVEVVVEVDVVAYIGFHFEVVEFHPNTALFRIIVVSTSRRLPIFDVL